MINPSASGWIDKFFIVQKFTKETVSTDSTIFYNNTRSTGFIYGHIISFNTEKLIDIKGWFKDEVSKVALLNTMYGIYCINNKDLSEAIFLEKAVNFYNKMNPQGYNIFKKNTAKKLNIFNFRKNN